MLSTHDNPSTQTQAWPRYFAICGIVLPVLLHVLHQSWTLPPFSPRQVINSDDLFPLLFAPWAGVTNLSTLVSRLLQIACIWRLPFFGVVQLVHGYFLWILVALVRTLVGYVLTRSVGWALPRLFSHYALYEASSGYGPMLVGLLLTSDGPKLPVPQLQPQPFVIGLSIILCWLDSEPWTYGIAIFCVSALVLIHLMFPLARTQGRDLFGTTSRFLPSQRSTTLRTALILIFLIVLANNLSLWTPTPKVSMPDVPPFSARLLDIIVLSFPRPDPRAGSKILTMTIESYIPILGNAVSFATFTHARNHPAFDGVQESFGSSKDIKFYKDTDTHPDAVSGQYLHLAEAFRWQIDRGSDQAEWVMLVEDDFPLCGGEAGRNALRTVMRLLEDGREEQNPIPLRRGAFIGTGGSGLIFHRSLLPIMIHILRTHADIASKLPPDMPRRPADVVMQDCLLGRDPLCPPKRPGGLIITSRLVMDHIGGMFSTNTRKTPNFDKWRCGWRHPFHGVDEVDVVVIDDLW